MLSENRPYLLFLLVLGMVPMINGCATTQELEWKWDRCYEGPPRTSADIAVLLVARDQLPLRVHSIDDESVSDSTEYHLAPGYHVIVTQPVGQGTTHTSDPATIGCTLEAGTAYGLTADVTWDPVQYQTTYWGWRSSQTYRWSPRVDELGSTGALAPARGFEDVLAKFGRSYLSNEPGAAWPYAMQRIVEKPPEHWRSTARPETQPPAEREEVSLAQLCGDHDCDIADALRAGVAEAEATGAGINVVTLRIKRKIDRPVQITVPAGTVFACRGSAQSMIALAEASIDLQGDAWHTLMVSAACVDFGRSVPQPSDTFMIQRWAHQKNLRKLMAVISRDAWPPGVQPRDVEQAIHVAQAAIWIVAGDANYEALGALRNTQEPSNPLAQLIQSFVPAERRGTRLIDETDAAMAMRLVDQAGVDITKRAIWQDCYLIVHGVSDPSLRNWIERR